MRVPLGTLDGCPTGTESPNGRAFLLGRSPCASPNGAMRSQLKGAWSSLSPGRDDPGAVGGCGLETGRGGDPGAGSLRPGVDAQLAVS